MRRERKEWWKKNRSLTKRKRDCKMEVAAVTKQLQPSTAMLTFKMTDN